MKWKTLLPLVGVCLFIYILSTLDITSLLGLFGSLPWWILLIALSFWLLPVCWTAFEWWYILGKHGFHVGLLFCFRCVLLGYFYGFVTPGGVGAYLRTLFLQQESGEPLEKCVANVVLLNSVDFISLLVLSVLGGVAVAGRYPWLLVMSLILLFLVVALFVLFLRYEFLGGILEKILRSRVFSSLGERVGEGSVFASLPSLSEMMVPLCFSLGGWIALFSLCYLVAPLFDVVVPYGFFILSFAVANVVGTLPITFYGLGTRDATLIGLFSVYGIAEEAVVSLSLFWFVAIWLIPSVLGGVVAFKKDTRPK